LEKLKALLRRLPEAGPGKIAHAALGVFGLIALAVTVTAIVESFANQVDFALAHGMVTWHGRIAPVAVDAFIVMGEVLLFAGILLRWRGFWLYFYAGFLTAFGFAMSVGANVFRDTPLPLRADQAVQAIWPVTATAALTGCLIIIKRLISGPRPLPAPSAAEETPPPAQASSRREPRPPKRAARLAGLAAARDKAVRDLAAQLARTPRGEWPSARSLADDQALSGSESTRRRDAGKALELAASMSNGNHDGGGD
jgi:hypothetical protein